MEIVVPTYINPAPALHHLKNHGAFQYGKFWNANVLSMNGEIGQGHLLTYLYDSMHIIRGRWKFNQETSFHSLDDIQHSKQIDFRLTVDGTIHSAFLEGAPQYNRDITTGDEIKFFLPLNCIGNQSRILEKMNRYSVDRNVAGLAKSLFNITFENNRSFILLESKLLEFTHLWLDYLNKKDIEKHFEGLSDLHLRLLIEAKEIIETSMENPYKIKELSRKIGLNEFYLKSGFKKLTGISIHQYTIQLRMERAKELILNTNLPIGEICNALGYTSRGHFSQLFLKYFGILPHQCRSSLDIMTSHEVH
jgi:AraC-like DNA-binding protein